MKICVKCNQPKQLSEFVLNRSGCKACKSAYDKVYNKVNQEKTREQKKAYREANKEIVSARKKVYNDANKEAIAIKKRAYYIANQDMFSKKRKARYAKNKEKILEKNREYFRTPVGRIGKINAENKRRYLKKSVSDGSIPIDVQYPLTKELKYLLERQSYKCNNCMCDITESKHLDHHIPLSKGGTHSINNVVWLCPTCNLKKSSKVPTQLLLL